MNAKCQIGKKVRNKYGELPEKMAERPIDWNRFDVDLIGPLTIKTPSGKKELLARSNDPDSSSFFLVMHGEFAEQYLEALKSEIQYLITQSTWATAPRSEATCVNKSTWEVPCRICVQVQGTLLRAR
jgi:hypothetical protein